ncbi:MAG: hypothetical protein AB8B58_18360 [Roseobacter sp.]
MNEIVTAAVCCGSNAGRGEAYLRAAAKLGSMLAPIEKSTLYGGTHKGLMGALAQGGQVVGVSPKCSKPKGTRTLLSRFLKYCQPCRSAKADY